MKIINMEEVIAVINERLREFCENKDDETLSKKDNDTIDNNVSDYKDKIMSIFKDIFSDTSAIVSKLETVIFELTNQHYVHCIDKDDVIKVLLSIQQHLINVQINEREQFDIVKKYLLDEI